MQSFLAKTSLPPPKHQKLSHHMTCLSCDLSDHLQESLGPPGPKWQKSLKKSLIGGLQKSPRKTRKKTFCRPLEGPETPVNGRSGRNAWALKTSTSGNTRRENFQPNLKFEGADGVFTSGDRCWLARLVRVVSVLMLVTLGIDAWLSSLMSVRGALGGPSSASRISCNPLEELPRFQGQHASKLRKVWVSINSCPQNLVTPPHPKKGPKWGKTVQISLKSSKLTLFPGGGTQFYGQNDFMDIWGFLINNSEMPTQRIHGISRANFDFWLIFIEHLFQSFNYG